MANVRRRRFSRREFVKAAGKALVAGALPAVSCRKGPGRAKPGRKTLKILQWSHFVPRYDRWFDNVFTKEWGEKYV